MVASKVAATRLQRQWLHDLHELGDGVGVASKALAKHWGLCNLCEPRDSGVGWGGGKQGCSNAAAAPVALQLT